MNILNPTGISKVRKSIILSANNADTHKQYNMLMKLKPFTQKIHTYPIPLANSTNGYCIDILVLQYLHLPRRNNQLKSGTKSYHFSCVLHSMQCERDVAIFSFFGILYIHTFKKLPIVIPNKPMVMYKNIVNRINSLSILKIPYFKIYKFKLLRCLTSHCRNITSCIILKLWCFTTWHLNCNSTICNTY